MTPWLLLGALIAALASSGAGYWAGYSRASAAAELREAQAVEQARQQMDDNRRRAQAVARRVAVAQQQAEVIYRDRDRIVQQIVERPVYRAECIDDDGLALINRALSGAQ